MEMLAYHGTGGVADAVAIVELNVGAVAADDSMDLGTEAGGACQTPFAA